MKKLFAIFLSFVLVFCMASCGEKGNSASKPERTDEVKDANVSVEIEGITYNEDEYQYYLDVTVTNNNNKAIGGYDSSLYLNGYNVDSNYPIHIAANATVKEQVLIEYHWISYYYNLCHLTEVDDVTLSLHILDEETSDDMGIVTTSAKIDKFTFNKNNHYSPDFKADINAKVYSDDKYEVTLLTINEGYLSDSTAFFLFENKNVDENVCFDCNTGKATSYSEVLDQLNNGKDFFVEINGKQVSCDDVVLGPGEEGVSKGKKSIFPVEFDIEDTGIPLKDITSFKGDFIIEPQDLLSTLQDTEFTVDWVK